MKKIYLLLLVLVAMFAACKKDRDVEFSTFIIEKEKIIPSYTTIELSCEVRCAATINELYLQYDTVADFSTYQEVALTENEKTEVYSVKIEDLLDNTKYYVRYLAVNSYSSVLSEDISEFKTLQAVAPIVEIVDVTNVLDTIATVGFVLKFDGGAEVSKMGVCWSKDSIPTIDDGYVEYSRDSINRVSDGDTLFLNISGLEGNTTYYARVYVENKEGADYSNSKFFLTLSLPKVRTEDITDIQLTTAILNGEILFNGNDTATIYGFCWGEKSMPIIDDNSVEIVKDFFSYRLSNLKGETQYYVRAYAKNKVGISYGDEKSFKTESVIIPIVETLEVTNITNTTAVVGGNVTFDGGAEVVARGVCYSTLKNPTISDMVCSAGTGVGEFSVQLKNLISDETYYVRAYAKNLKGVSYGQEISFVAKEERCVDLGLSVMWATCNVGASSPEEYGDYFAWGEVEPKEVYSWETYKYCDGTYTSFTKYCVKGAYGKDGFVDNKIVLDSEDDAATVNWGNSWRMPTRVELKELHEKCIWTWTTLNGINGYRVTGPNGNSIFLPAAGTMLGSEHSNVGTDGQYLSNYLKLEHFYDVELLLFYSEVVSSDVLGIGRRLGRSVRPVLGNYSDSQYTIEVYSYDSLMGTVSGSGTYDRGTQVTLTATPNPGHKFVSWSGGNKDNPRVITVVRDDIYTAHFEVGEKKYTIAVYSHDNSRGTVSGGGTYNEGFQVAITAIANSGYKFKEWNDGNTDNPRVITVTKDNIYTAHFEVDNSLIGHEYVDLGLSVKWATCNIGADYEWEYGDNFAWGEIETKSSYNWSNYLYCQGEDSTLTKYCVSSACGLLDYKTQLDLSDDVVYLNWGSGWQIPTISHWKELLDNCSIEEAKYNGVECIRVVSSINGNSILLPYEKNKLPGIFSTYYWSSSLHSSNSNNAYGVSIGFQILNKIDIKVSNIGRYKGNLIRPVCL